MKRTSIGLLAVVAWMLAVGVTMAGTWSEVGDAPPFLPGQQTVGTGSLDLIDGMFVGGADVDLYEIKVVDFASFLASTVGLTTSDTRLYLFDADGLGVTYDDDTATSAQSTLTSQFLTANGTYYLAVTRYNVIANNGNPTAYIWNPNPYNVERAPDGPGAPGPLGGWVGASFASDNKYAVALTGVRFGVPAPLTGDMNCDGVVDFGDIDPFVLALTSQSDYEAAFPNCNYFNADCNYDGLVDFNDIDPFVALFGG